MHCCGRTAIFRTWSAEGVCAVCAAAHRACQLGEPWWLQRLQLLAAVHQPQQQLVGGGPYTHFYAEFRLQFQSSPRPSSVTVSLATATHKWALPKPCVYTIYLMMRTEKLLEKRQPTALAHYFLAL